MREFIIGTRFNLVLGGVSVVSILITYIINKIFIKNRFVKYIPGILFLIIGFFNLCLAIKFLGSSKDIVKGALFIMGMVAGFISLLTGLIIEICAKEEVS
ncbi:hypothetical protein KQI42_05280 [Tissierella sp. MSJ-40]|uniref:Uncharacterized protein n=1 Tax=Tissierella simiarum TaxID=2841534 RepID=A0ABS6E4N8_9FIRM|nr:hypothetical protein [Tissierella simiarum]MBU5437410.1 hypothetical protein [Tissierella simiarum]